MATRNTPDSNREVQSDFNEAISLLAGQDHRLPQVEGRYHRIDVWLNDVRDLFSVTPDPFDPAALERPGIETVINQLKPIRLTRPLRLVIHLPGVIPDGLLEQTQAALARYCRARLAETRLELTSLRWQGLKALQTGLIFLSVCLFLSAGADGAEWLPESLRQLASESFIIAGWVSMWHPAELLLYAWWPYWRATRIYQRIHDAEVLLVGT